MDAPNNPTYEYQVGGSLKINAPCYVWRQADDDLYASLQGGAFCYVFNCRQMGKSSLRVQVMRRLKAEGFSCGAIDLTTIGSGEITADKWYRGLILELHRIFKLSKQVNLKTWLADSEQLPPVQRLSLYLEEVLLAQVAVERIVIFIDEIDSILKLNFPTSDFFALIRACYNQRADNPAFERLTFVLLGVATPSDLVQDAQQTPFNIGRAIALEGLKFEKSAILAEGLVGKAENLQQVLQEILRWTGGQPFLTQKLCQIVRNQAGAVIQSGEEADKVQQLVQAQILDNWEFQDDPQHLRTIRDRLLNNEQKAGRLLGLYQQILEQGGISADGSPEQVDLQLTGLVVKRGDKLEVYNLIYREVFNRNWVEENLTRLRPSFYGEAIKAWLVSGKQDESRLLRGLALQEAQFWAKGKRLSDQDYQFLRSSEELAKGQVEQALETQKQANSILEEAKQKLEEANRTLEEATQEANQKLRKANSRIRIGTGILIISLMAATIAGVKAWTAEENRKIAETQRGQTTQALEQKKEELADAKTNFKQLDSKVQQVKRQEQEARKRLTEAEKNRNKALDLKKQAEHQTLVTQGNKENAEQALQQAKVQLTQAEIELQTAANEVKNKQSELGELKQERQKIEGQLSIAQQLYKKAQTDREIALEEAVIAREGTKLEQQGTSILRRFREDNPEQLELLLEAMRIGYSLYDLVKNEKNLSKYPAISPLYTLHTILQEIREKNKFIAHEKAIYALAFSPDGKYLATGSEDKTARLWDLKGNLIAEFKGHQGTIYALAFSPDGKYLATGSEDKTARLWDLKGNLVAEFKGHQKGISALDFSPDGKYLATGSWDKTARLCDLKGNLIAEFKDHQGEIDALGFSPDGQYLATSSFRDEEGSQLWDLKGNLVAKFRGMFGGFSAQGDDKYIYTFVREIRGFSEDGIIYWDLKGNFLAQLNQKKLFGEVDINSKSVGTSDKKGLKYLASPSGSTVKLWEFEENFTAEFKGHQDSVNRVAFSPDGKYLATSSDDQTARLWDLKGNLVTEFKGHYNALAFSPDGKYLATVAEFAPGLDGESYNETILWNLKGKQLTEFKNNSGAIFSPDGKYLATVSGDKTARLWDLKGNLVAEFKGHQGSVNRVAFSPDGKYLVTSSDDQTARLWDLKGNLVTEFKGHQEWISALAFSPDGKYLATGSGDKTARLWDLKGNLIAELKTHQGRITDLAFSPDGKYLATDSGDKTARLWDLKGNLIAEFKGHQKPVNRVAFSPDGNYLATGSEDQTARLWDLKGNLIAEFKGHQGEIADLAFSPDGNYLATGSNDNTARLWKVEGLDELLARGCDWLQDYLASHPDEAQDVHQICQNYNSKAKK